MTIEHKNKQKSIMIEKDGKHKPKKNKKKKYEQKNINEYMKRD